MAFTIPTLDQVRKLADKISKPVSYTVADEDGKAVTFAGKLEGCCRDTPEAIAQLAAAQNKERINFSRKKVVLAGGLVNAGEIHEVRPAKLSEIFLLYKDVPAVAEPVVPAAEPVNRIKGKDAPAKVLAPQGANGESK